MEAKIIIARIVNKETMILHMITRLRNKLNNFIWLALIYKIVDTGKIHPKDLSESQIIK